MTLQKIVMKHTIIILFLENMAHLTTQEIMPIQNTLNQQLLKY